MKQKKQTEFLESLLTVQDDILVFEEIMDQVIMALPCEEEVHLEELYTLVMEHPLNVSVKFKKKSLILGFLKYDFRLRYITCGCASPTNERFARRCEHG